MQQIKGDPPSYAGSLMPPATTRRFPDRPTSSSQDARIVPPFVPTQTEASREPEAARAFEPEPAGPVAAEPVAAASESPPVETPAEPATELVAFAEFLTETDQPEMADTSLDAEPSQTSWESLVEEDGIVEPAYESDNEAILQELSEQAAELSRHDEFPLEAFIVPKEAQHIPSGVTAPTDTEPPLRTPVTSLAERLEKLSHRLRVEESEAIVRRLAAGDRLDTLLAGLLAGYLAGKSEQ